MDGDRGGTGACRSKYEEVHVDKEEEEEEGNENIHGEGAVSFVESSGSNA